MEEKVEVEASQRKRVEEEWKNNNVHMLRSGHMSPKSAMKLEHQGGCSTSTRQHALWIPYSIIFNVFMWLMIRLDFSALQDHTAAKLGDRKMAKVALGNFTACAAQTWMSS